MLESRTGNILDDDAAALINTVNTVGVMGIRHCAAVPPSVSRKL